MTASILALFEGDDAGLRAAMKLADESGSQVHLACIGPGRPPAYGWARAFEIDSDDGRAVASAVAELLKRSAYSAIVASDTRLCREVMGRLAGKLRLPLAGRVLTARMGDRDVEVARSIEGGKRTARFRLAALPALLLIDPEASIPSPRRVTGMGEVEALAVGATTAIELLEERTLDPTEIDLGDAEVVVAGGRGMAGPEGFRLLEELARMLNGAVGASRVAVDLGWAPKSAQVGLSGKTVMPRLYFACGISGAMHHTLGMRESGFVVAINKDSSAPILGVADIGIVGDATAVLKALIAALRRREGVETRLPATVGAGA